jgi:hypothetical protein
MFLGLSAQKNRPFPAAYLAVPQKGRNDRALQAAEKGQMPNEKPEKRPSGAKAHVDLIALAARLKSCPDASRDLLAFFRSLFNP